MSTQTELQTPEAADVRSRKGTPTWEIARLFPHQGEWTEADYLALDTNQLIELSDGCLEFLPIPTLFHQRFVLFVLEALRRYVAENNLEGDVLPAPLRIRTVPGKIREPDVVFIKPERIADRHSPPNGADLVVEIVSPGEDPRQRDLETKPEEYARAGIGEFWIVDPETQIVTVHSLEGDRYRVHGQFKKGQTADSVLLNEFRLDVSALFSTGQTGEKKS